MKSALDNRLKMSFAVLGALCLSLAAFGFIYDCKNGSYFYGEIAAFIFGVVLLMVAAAKGRGARSAFLACLYVAAGATILAYFILRFTFDRCFQF